MSKRINKAEKVSNLLQIYLSHLEEVMQKNFEIRLQHLIKNTQTHSSLAG